MKPLARNPYLPLGIGPWMKSPGSEPQLKQYYLQEAQGYHRGFSCHET